MRQRRGVDLAPRGALHLSDRGGGNGDGDFPRLSGGPRPGDGTPNVCPSSTFMSGSPGWFRPSPLPRDLQPGRPFEGPGSDVGF